MVDRSYKVFAFLFAGIFLISLLANSVFAGPVEDIGDVIDSISSGLQPIFSLILGNAASDEGGFSSGELLFSKVMFFAIIMSIIWLGLSKVDMFKQNLTVLWVVSIAAAILATRWLGDADIVQSIILPYSALGVVISAGLPFFIWFSIVNLGMKDAAPSVRRIAWVFFTVVFISLWILRYEELPHTFAWIYVVTAGAGLLMAGLDGTIRRFFTKLELERLGASSAEDAIVGLRKDLAELPELVKVGALTAEEEAKRRRKLEQKIFHLSKRL